MPRHVCAPRLLAACVAALACAYSHAAFPVPPSADWQSEMGLPVSAEQAAELREEVREMVRRLRRSPGHDKTLTPAPHTPLACLAPTQFTFTYDSYMHNAFPHDELRPLSCSGVVRLAARSATHARGVRLAPRPPHTHAPARRTRWAATR